MNASRYVVRQRVVMTPCASTTATVVSDDDQVTESETPGTASGTSHRWSRTCGSDCHQHAAERVNKRPDHHALRLNGSRLSCGALKKIHSTIYARRQLQRLLDGTTRAFMNHCAERV